MSGPRYPPGPCHYCGSRTQITRDHIVPRSRGGTNFAWNLVAACYRCNQRKADKIPTCKCPYCQAAITSHWQYLMEIPDYTEQNRLVLKVMSLFENRWE